jgi:hypothetical protein
MDFLALFGGLLALASLAVTVTPRIQNWYVASVCWAVTAIYCAWIVSEFGPEIAAGIGKHPIVFTLSSASLLGLCIGMVGARIQARRVAPSSSANEQGPTRKEWRRLRDRFAENYTDDFSLEWSIDSGGETRWSVLQLLEFPETAVTPDSPRIPNAKYVEAFWADAAEAGATAKRAGFVPTAPAPVRAETEPGDFWCSVLATHSRSLQHHGNNFGRLTDAVKASREACAHFISTATA